MRSTNESANEGVNEMLNRTVRLVSRPVGIPDDTTWAVADESMPAIAPGQFMVATEFLSLDPAMRGWVSTAKSYIPPVRIGSVMRAYGVGRVVESQHPSYAIGDTVSGPFGVSEYCVTDGFDVSRVDESVATLPTWLGALGFPGLTAYYGLFDVGKISPGDTVVISGAAGAVGHLAGQMAKIHGCTVIGIAGGKEKCAWLTDDLGFDAAIDYKNESVYDGLRRHAPGGVDVYFDNVGGTILDDVLSCLTIGARIVICGAISGYNSTEPPPGPSRYLALLVNRASMSGFVVFDYLDRYEDTQRHIASWLHSGALKTREEVVGGGIVDFGESLNLLFSGNNRGKLLLAVN
ncbi:NADP-dependent oxidoreductase [Rhodococcus erythropolis]